MRDSWHLAVGTFTAVPTVTVSGASRRTVAGAMLLAPMTTAPVAVGWVALGLLSTHALLPYAVAAVLALVVAALVSRALHLDGLADLADGLTSGYDPGHSLDVMRRGNTGPAGAVALVLVVGLDAACLAGLLADADGVALAVTALVASRLAPAICARDGIPAAREVGLGHEVAGTVPRPALVCLVASVTLGAAVAAAAVAASSAGDPAEAGVQPWWATAFAASAVALVGAAASVVTRRRAVQRLGGITGDVIGAAIEIALAAALVAAAAAHTAL